MRGSGGGLGRRSKWSRWGGGRLCEQTQSVKMEVRPRVLKGEPVPFGCSVNSADLCDPWYPFVTHVTASVDGGASVPVAAPLNGGAKWQPLSGSLPLPKLGRHEVAIKLRVEFWSVDTGRSADEFYVPQDAKKALIHAYDVTRTAMVEITDEPSQVVRCVPDPGA